MERRAAESRDERDSTARILAGFALAVSIVVVGVVVAGSVGGSGTDETTGTTEASACRPSPFQRYYVVKPGENLTVVADKFGIAPKCVLKRNPDLDAQQVPEGECVNLIPDGCKAISEQG